MKKLLILVSLFCLATLSQAQDYNTGIGLRGGPESGLSIKHFISGNTAIEGLFASRWDGLNITGLYEIHAQAFNEPGLNWYYGFGGHIGFWDGNHSHWDHDDSNHTVFGVDGILGLEYNFREIPINLSLDWKPALNIFGDPDFWGDNGALSIRYVF